MSYVDLGDGVFVDEVTGEVEGIEPGTDKLLLIARRLEDAQLQVKAWERLEGVCKAVLLKEQVERVTSYDGLIVSVRQNPRSEVDGARFVELLEQYEVPRSALLKVIQSSKVPPAQIPAEMAACVNHSMTRPFVVAERARKRAPGS